MKFSRKIGITLSYHKRDTDELLEAIAPKISPETYAAWKGVIATAKMQEIKAGSL